MRLVFNTHIKYLFNYLKNNNITYDIYFYTNNYNTARINLNNNFVWKYNLLDIDIINDIINKIKSQDPNAHINIVNDIDSIKSEDYVYNLTSQLTKFKSVLEMIDNNKDYQYIIRLRPDIYFTSNIILPDINTIYQNLESSGYEGDSIQIFNYIHIKNILNQIKNIKIDNDSIYEYILCDIFKKSNLNIIWIKNFASRWYSNHSIINEDIDINYINDWKNLEYKYPFTI
jgi:hypothetical protein